MRFQREEYTAELISEMEPLWKAHYDEIAMYKDIPLDPDLAIYETIALHGSLRIFTLRDETDTLKGYEVFFVKPHPHYRTSIVAMQDILYLAPEMRMGMTGYKFIQWCDEQLKADGVQMVMQHVKAAHDFSAVLERMGYQHHDHIMTRRLD